MAPPFNADRLQAIVEWYHAVILLLGFITLLKYPLGDGTASLTTALHLASFLDKPKLLGLYRKVQEGGVIAAETIEDYLNFNRLFKVKVSSKKVNHTFKTERTTYDVDIAQLPRSFDPIVSIRILPRILDSVIRSFEELVNPEDRILLELNSGELSEPFYLTLRRVGDYNVDQLMSRIELLNSQKKFSIDETFKITVTRIRSIRGGSPGRRIHQSSLDDRKNIAKCLVSVWVDNNLCLPAALILGKKRAQPDFSRGNKKSFNSYQRLSRKGKVQPGYNCKLGREARKIVKQCGLVVGAMLNITDDLRALQSTAFSEFQVIVWDEKNNVIATVPETKQPGMSQIHLLYSYEHFDLITSITGWTQAQYVCDYCLKQYSHKSRHRCKGNCHSCYRANESCVQEENGQLCDTCGRTFRNDACFAEHIKARKGGRTYCEKFFICTKCEQFISMDGRRLDEDHQCGEFHCFSCEKWVQHEGHLCYMKPVEPKQFVEDPKYIFYDIETYLTTDKEHKAMLIAAQYCNGETFCFPPTGVPMTPEYDVEKAFGQWLFSESHKGYTVFAHNNRGYDGYFIMKYIIEKTSKEPKVVYRGSQLIYMEYPALNMKFRDTLNYVGTSLAMFPAVVNLPNVVKGDFPHKLNKPENWDKRIAFPTIEDFYLEKLSAKERGEFSRWHETEKIASGGFYNFRENVVNYCVNDVTTLRECAMKFRELFFSCTKIDVYESATIASACRKFHDTYILEPETIGIISGHGYQANRRTSQEATEYFEYLNTLPQYEGSLIHGRNGKEVKVGRYFVDGLVVNKETDKKEAHEFNGCVFHGHTCQDKEATVPYRRITMTQASEETERKRKYLNSQGLVVKTMWSCQWTELKNGDETVRKFVRSLNLSERLEPRDAFYGGRTEAMQLHAEVGPGEQIHYFDVVSMYPAVNKYDIYPIGHPEIILANFADLDSYTGLVKCRVLAPPAMHIPVLPVKTNGKLVFCLCKLCAEAKNEDLCLHSDQQRSFVGTWTTMEVQEARRQGYQVLEVLEVWHFSECRAGLFGKYIDIFMQIKMEASGWPEWCVSEVDRVNYIAEVRERQGISLQRDGIVKNPGKRAVAKIMLNSFWGKYGQRDDLTKTHFFRKPEKYVKLIGSAELKIHNILPVNDDCMMVVTSQKDEYNEGNYGTNLVLAAFTTSHARLRLLSMLQKLDKRVLYCDTDSVIFKSGPLDWQPEVSDQLGQWSSELHTNEYITRFVSLGPKVYGYWTNAGKEELKFKGITRNSATQDLYESQDGTFVESGKSLNASLLFDMLEQKDLEHFVHYKNIIARKKETHTLTTTAMMKKIRFTFDKRSLQLDFTSFPFGTR